ncbi:hypothetical protein [Ancylobacter mangrovi]|uniref:Uncharacterized protein n=1 Tax=Ancylobacter mangrovi TaxID=2972472 RepID=A0A9X2PM67_9HYPH|nr:hypothetical protein [Ancylobacter mangrovi]MCS0496363.1 hypothetical protein [Ancylobacter mangrovi]MCS0504375.1 hypothetical protein [Ancylobacter mangrovi]
MPYGEFDIVTLSPSTVRVMHKVAHHIYEFSVVDDGNGGRTVSHGPSIVFGKDGEAFPAWELVPEAERVAVEAASYPGVIG